MSVTDLISCLEKAAKYDDVKSSTASIGGQSEGPFMLGPALPLTAILSNSLSGMTMNLAIVSEWCTLWLIWPPRNKSLLDHQPQQKRGRDAPATEESLTN